MARPSVPFHSRHLARTIFVSLPARRHLIDYVERVLSEAIHMSFGRMQATSFRLVRQGAWLPQIENSIAYSNAVVAFLEENKANVLIEIGEAYALGKPLILVVGRGQKLPAMLQHLQMIRVRARDPSDHLTRSIVTGLDEAVFSSFHREQSDFRTRLQERLLTGAELMQTRNIRRSGRSRALAATDELLQDAQRHHRAGDFGSAIECLQRCITDGLREEAVFHLLADTWFLDGEAAVDREEAEKSYEQMLCAAESGLGLHPASFLLRKDRALALLKKGRIDDAERGFRALLGEPENGIIHYNLACVAAQRRDVLTTLAELRAAMHKVPYYRGLARVDPDFDPVWVDALFQALIFGKQ